MNDVVVCACMVVYAGDGTVSGFFFFFSSRRRHTRWNCDWSSDVCSSDLLSRLLDAHKIIIGQCRELAERADQLGDDGTNDLAVSDVLRTNELQVWFLSEHLVDRKSTRLNSSHSSISYAVFCLKKKTRTRLLPTPTALLSACYTSRRPRSALPGRSTS